MHQSTSPAELIIHIAVCHFLYYDGAYAIHLLRRCQCIAVFRLQTGRCYEPLWSVPCDISTLKPTVIYSFHLSVLASFWGSSIFRTIVKFHPICIAVVTLDNYQLFGVPGLFASNSYLQYCDTEFQTHAFIVA